MFEKISRIGKGALVVTVIGLVLASIATASPVAMFARKADAAPACQTLAIAGVNASGYQAGNTPTNAVDNNLSTRWSNYGASWIRADLGKQETICSVDVAWYHGNSRINTFSIAVSNDGTTYTTVYSGKSSGTTSAPELYSFASIDARYVRIAVTSNTQTGWTSINEIEVNGYTPVTDTTAPAITITQPLANTALSSTSVSVTGTASDASGVQAVAVSLDGGAYTPATSVTSWSTWTAKVTTTSGSHTITARATDDAGNQKTISVSFTVSSTTTSTTLDKFGIKKLYPTKSGGNEWFVNMDSPTSDPMFRNLPSMTKQSDGSWQVSASQVRMEAWSPTDQKWQNVEITEYAKIIGGTNQLLQMYTRGGHHTTSDPCQGSAVKARLYGDGHAAWVKEINHPAYTGNRGSVQVTSTPLLDRWVGFKAVVYNVVGSDGKTYVRMESYIDDSVTDSHGNLVINNNWKLASVVEDHGGWATSDPDFVSSCSPLNVDSTQQYRQKDEILSKPGGTSTANLGAFRSDDLTWDWKYLSVREISTPTS